MDSEPRQRLDSYLVAKGLAASRRQARELISSGAVLINGRVHRKGDLVRETDRILVTAQRASEELKPNPALALEVLYESAELLVVNKPGGLPCHPLRADELHTVMNSVVARFPETSHAGVKLLEGGLAHRLDNGTSGALLIARSSQAFIGLRRALAEGRIMRRYEALVKGQVGTTMVLTAPIAHCRRSARRMVAIDPEQRRRRRTGRPALTRIEPVRWINGYSLLSVWPASGNRHQIRVHLANAGFPLVGDSLYGGPASSTLAEGRFFLHLAELCSVSPFEFRVCAPLAPDLAHQIRQIAASERPAPF